jgi:hypothetical protein
MSKKKRVGYTVQVELESRRVMLPITVAPGDTIRLTYNLNIDPRMTRHMSRSDFNNYLHDIVKDRAEEIYNAVRYNPPGRQEVSGVGVEDELLDALVHNITLASSLAAARRPDGQPLTDADLTTALTHNIQHRRRRPRRHPHRRSQRRSHHQLADNMARMVGS